MLENPEQSQNPVDQSARPKKEVLAQVIELEVDTEQAKLAISIMSVFVLSIICGPITHRFTKENSYVQDGVSFIILIIGFSVFFYRVYKYAKKTSLQKRFRKGECESSETVEELEKREKALESSVYFWNNSLWLVAGLTLGIYICEVLQMLEPTTKCPTYQNLTTTDVPY